MSDQHGYRYSLRRITWAPMAQDFMLGPDSGYLISVLRAAYESAQNLLPPGVFEEHETAIMARLLCGDYIPEDFNRQIMARELLGLRSKSVIWLCRVTEDECSKLPLRGLPLRIFEALLLVGRQQTSGRKDLLDAALMFVWGMPLEQIDRVLYPV